MDEKEIFAELSMLCKSPGYIHAVAHLCFRDNMMVYENEMTTKDMLHLFSTTRLIRTEISTIIGLMVQGDIDYGVPAPDVLQQYIERTEALLEDIHKTLGFAGLTPDKLLDPEFNLLSQGEFIREPIFYGGESAYIFQYRDFSTKKYEADDGWLLSNKGFTIESARTVVNGIERLLNTKPIAVIAEIRSMSPYKWTMLPMYIFCMEEVVGISGVAPSTVGAILNAFALPVGENNQQFQSLNDFNVVNASPLLRTEDGRFLLLQQYSLAESLYESPFYWMVADKTYQSTAMQNRGRFTEEFCHERLALVFGSERVFSNVDIFESKSKKVGEIDVLVIYGDRAIVVQAKSKRLTIESRKGNDGCIRDDFKKSIQDSYDQGLLCSKLLNNSALKFSCRSSGVVTIYQKLKEIYIFCVVSDHYPALSFQVRQFLKTETLSTILPPFIMDVFTLDAMTEMLPSPLYFLSYVNRRVNYSDRLIASHELTILSYHLKGNLWIEDDLHGVLLTDDISADLDVAMTVRREGVHGKRTPDGILTRFSATAVGRILKVIEAKPDPATIDLGFFLLTLSEDSVRDISEAIAKISELSQRDGNNHDFSVGFRSSGCGLTIHSNYDPTYIASSRLKTHCELRKYAEKAGHWFGICVNPDSMLPRFGLFLDYRWRQSTRMDSMTRKLSHPISMTEALASVGHKCKVGRNDPCSCGSGKKFKKCCLGQYS